jgi:hypothetical protein
MAANPLLSAHLQEALLVDEHLEVTRHLLHHFLLNSTERQQQRTQHSQQAEALLCSAARGVLVGSGTLCSVSTCGT